MAKATHVRHCVMVSIFVRWVAGSFHIYHDLFPAFPVYWFNRYCFLFRRSFPVPETCQTLADPDVDVTLHVGPVYYSPEDLKGLIF